jgi:antibiotic biosynthesis monooxygenase (ABM) superfamily enzyme
MNHELKMFAIKLVGTLLATPLMGWGLMVVAEKFEASWKTNNRKKKWLASCGIFLVLAAISGWFL